MMKSVEQAQKDYQELLSLANSRDEESDMFRLMNKGKAIVRAKRSEAFAHKVLPKFLPLVKECVERGSESYYITLNDGRKYVYYPTKCNLRTIVNGKQARKIILEPNRFLKYFSFLEK